jgi:MFS transporter, DHA1 family, inner membrane transport protein
MPAPTRVLPALVLAQLLGTSPWFAVNAVMPDLQRAYGWPAADVGTLTSAVQAGFILGTLVFAVLAVADRFSARRVFLLCALASAGCTLAAAASVPSFAGLWAWRAATGFCLAGIYPVGMKIASQWFPNGLGTALGLLVGALVLGTASPHALRALGAQWPWAWVFAGVAAASVAGGLLVLLAIPEPETRPTARGAGLHLRDLASLWTDHKVRASAFGYFGHMWELYTVLVLAPLILSSRLQGAALSWGAFAVVGAGAIGCVAGGWLARRWGSARVAGANLALSGGCALLTPWMMAAGDGAFAVWILVWGITVAGDSPQLSALTAANAPRHAVGSVLTLTNCLGFAISIVSIQCFSAWIETASLGTALPWLAVGPALGLALLWPLMHGERQAALARSG